MNTPENLQQTTDREVAALRDKLAFSKLLPVTPDLIGDSYPNWARWVTYKVRTLTDAVDIARSYGNMLVPAIHVKNGCLEIKPAALFKNPDTDYEAESLFRLDVHQGPGFGPTVKLKFFVRLPDGQYVAVHCALPDRTLAGATLVKEVRNQAGAVVGPAVSKPNTILQALFHGYIGWWVDVPGKDAHFTYWLANDLTEALAVLENTPITDWWKG